MTSTRSLPLALVLLVAALAAGCANPQASPSEQQAATGAERQPQEGAIALDWQPPQDRTDGSALARRDIAGYRIYVGDRPGEHITMMDVADPGQTNAIVGDLEPDKEYFVAISTIDSLGQESPKSREIREIAKPIQEVQMALEEQQARERGKDRRRG